MFQDTWALVVESDAHHLVALTTLLKELGIKYKRNTTGINVPEQIQFMQPQPKLIFLDMDLPDMDTFAICQAIQALPDREKPQVIALGGNHWAQHRSQMQAAGFVGFISKPFPRKQIGPILRRVLEGKDTWED